MSNNAATDNKTAAPSASPVPSNTNVQSAPLKGQASDAKSIMSDTATLCDAADSKQKDSKSSTTLGSSSTAFAKKAKEQGWAAPTATRPSFG
ncbi:hypothetical protein C8Q80DRAFT_1266102 [Daedaleopsis nitida]|nr:hypothetical protein C8Q80DRAFT_1266102 [Daedaleopsis nitida]